MILTLYLLKVTGAFCSKLVLFRKTGALASKLVLLRILLYQRLLALLKFRHQFLRNGTSFQNRETPTLRKLHRKKAPVLGSPLRLFLIWTLNLYNITYFILFFIF